MSDRLRVTIPDVPLTVQPAETDIDGFSPAGRGESVRRLPASAEDRSEGRTRLEVVVGGWRFEATVESAARAELKDRAARDAAAHHRAADTTVRAQIPGRVVRLWVAEGELVEAGQRLLAIEAMKMENEIRAPHAGTVGAIKVEVGALVERHDELLEIK
ncbi:MAG TPA: acetyl-CoA carboxylase biotin carboxyl carrier protein subunit [Candidatus Limnocylindria bacterium]|nr:acetyl-CoA carboxylase biotin carboxyl carrier protein subunit [Candidatus Limnocylindria bacterium]